MAALVGREFLAADVLNDFRQEQEGWVEVVVGRAGRELRGDDIVEEVDGGGVRSVDARVAV